MQATQTANPASIESDYRTWLTTLWPETYVTRSVSSLSESAPRDATQLDTGQINVGGLASYHAEYWDWLWGIVPTGPGPDGNNCFVQVWGRGWGKSTNIETGCVALAAHSRRRYGWYISGRQAQADDHLYTVSQRFLSPGVARYYPQLAEAKTQIVHQRGRQLAWNRRRVWTADGFVIEAVGLDAVGRGAKLDDQRIDFMIFDDVDATLDTDETIERKIAALTRTIIPSQGPGCIFLVAQNLIHPNGIVTRLVDGRATYLGSRTVSGPHPAILGLEYEGMGTDAIITAGTPTWDVLGIAECQQKIKDAGIDSFLAECQHSLTYFGEARFSRESLAAHAENIRPPLAAKALTEHPWAHDPYLSVWGLPIAGAPYVAYFDGAEGVGSDYCVTMILRADTRQLVAMLRDNKREQGQHAKVAAEVIRQYNNAYVGWERSHEADFAAIMAAEGITRIYRHKEEQTRAQQINGTDPTQRTGYPARQRERQRLVARVANYIVNHEGVIPSEVVIWELQSFIKTQRQPDGEAAAGAHDDTVFAFGGALLMCEQPGAQSLITFEPRRSKEVPWGF